MANSCLSSAVLQVLQYYLSVKHFTVSMDTRANIGYNSPSPSTDKIANASYNSTAIDTSANVSDNSLSTDGRCSDMVPV